MSIGRDTTGKTGTINNHAAVWFAGSTPDLSAAVWVGNPLGGFAHPLQNVVIKGRYYREVFGLSIPGPVWKASMLGALAGSEPVPMQLQNEWGLGPARQVGIATTAQAGPSRTAECGRRGQPRAAGNRERQRQRTAGATTEATGGGG